MRRPGSRAFLQYMPVDLPSVTGDPAGMRALAAALRSTAAAVGASDSAVWGRACVLEFSGPAATRLADEMRAWHTTVRSAADELLATADLLLRAAAQVEQELEDRRRLLQAMAEAHAK